MAFKIFFCYAHEDEDLLNKLKAHLKPLQREGLIEVWYDRNISAGKEWEREISQHLDSAQVILLLVSPDFMNSDYCYSIEMKRALERYDHGEAQVIPIIVRHVHWQVTLLGKLQALPKDAKPIASKSWHSQDEALFDVVKGIREIIDKFQSTISSNQPKLPSSQNAKNKKTSQVTQQEQIDKKLKRYKKQLVDIEGQLDLAPNPNALMSLANDLNALLIRIIAEMRALPLEAPLRTYFKSKAGVLENLRQARNQVLMAIDAYTNYRGAFKSEDFYKCLAQSRVYLEKALKYW